MCYVIRALGVDGLVTTNDRKMILAIDSKFGLSILRSKLQDFRNELISKYFNSKSFYLTILNQF